MPELSSATVPPPEFESPGRHLPKPRVTPVLIAYAVVIVLVFAGRIVSASFLTFHQLAVLLGIAAVLGIASAGQTLVVLSAGIDLSIGAVISAADVLTVQWTQSHHATTLLVLAAIVMLGGVVGLLNGFGVSILRIQPLVMTLGMSAIVTGMVLVITNGQSGGQPAGGLSRTMNGDFLGIPGTAWAWFAVAIATLAVLRYAAFGRAVFAFGSNPRAARLAGIRPTLTIVVVYVLAGAAAAVAGIVLGGYTGTGAYGIGDSYTMTSVAAVVIGGTSILGGRGSYAGTIAGVLILSLLDDILQLANLAISARQIIQGVAILIVIVLYGRERRLRTVS